MSGEREVLETEVWERIDPEGMGWASGDAPSISEVLDAVLASDWLTAHVAAAVVAERERIALAIAAMEPFAHGKNETSKSFLIGWGTAKRRVLRIARPNTEETP